MTQLKFNKELYSKTALIKASYNFTDIAYIHLDTDEKYYYVSIENKQPEKKQLTKNEFENEMLAQSVRHVIYKDTKNIREIVLARAMASSVIVEKDIIENNDNSSFSEDEILKDWFESNDNIND